MNIITKEFVDLLFPEHGRTSCSDTDPQNGYVHYEDGSPRCCRCMALQNIGEPISAFKIAATIKVPPDPAEVKKRALNKLTPFEREALGL